MHPYYFFSRHKLFNFYEKKYLFVTFIALNKIFYKISYRTLQQYNTFSNVKNFIPKDNREKFSTKHILSQLNKVG